MKRLKIKYFLYVLLVSVLITSICQWSVTSSGGVKFGYTGAPDEASCTSCHNATENEGPGATFLHINGGNIFYEPGKVYPIVLEVKDKGILKFGFQIVALFDNDNSNAGTLIQTDFDNTLSYESDSRRYVTHSNLGTMSSDTGNMQWNFDWKAPEVSTGPVTFYYCVNSSNKSNTAEGDRIYRQTYAIQPIDTPVAEVLLNREGIDFFYERQTLLVNYNFTKTTEVSLELYHINGVFSEKLCEESIGPGSTKRNYQLSSHPDHLYLMKYTLNGHSHFRKIIMNNK
jgi:hypothetical protein